MLYKNNMQKQKVIVNSMYKITIVKMKILTIISVPSGKTEDRRESSVGLLVRGRGPFMRGREAGALSILGMSGSEGKDAADNGFSDETS